MLRFYCMFMVNLVLICFQRTEINEIHFSRIKYVFYLKYLWSWFISRWACSRSFCKISICIVWFPIAAIKCSRRSIVSSPVSGNNSGRSSTAWCILSLIFWRARFSFVLTCWSLSCSCSSVCVSLSKVCLIIDSVGIENNFDSSDGISKGDIWSFQSLSVVWIVSCSSFSVWTSISWDCRMSPESK